MKRVSTLLLSGIAILAVGTIPVAISGLGWAGTGSAYAKGGNGGGNGHGHGNAAGHDNQSAHAGNAASGPDTQNGNLGNNHGKISSALGRLNAAHASDTARAHASPNSAVGRVAAYENAAQISAAVNTLNDPNATQEEIEAAKESLVQLGVDPENPPTPEEAATAEVEALAAAANKSIAPQDPNDDQDNNGVSDTIQNQVDALLGLADNQ